MPPFQLDAMLQHVMAQDSPDGWKMTLWSSYTCFITGTREWINQRSGISGKKYQTDMYLRHHPAAETVLLFVVLVLGVPAGQATEEATNATRVATLLSVALVGGAAVAKKAAENAPKRVQTTEKATNTTGVAALLSATLVGGAAIAEKTAENAP
ncbi:uncharacterized protein PG986_010432 [Apiospora aurea]|uniref:Uncharacterized protein n=1 Tax=Apiospora aurea TaxID=335848 RepID=A0ABR1Q281_9PEZI